jgi:hypothetical protein
MLWRHSLTEYALCEFKTFFTNSFAAQAMTAADNFTQSKSKLQLVRKDKLKLTAEDA